VQRYGEKFNVPNIFALFFVPIANN
jgi:hypothetical protein